MKIKILSLETSSSVCDVALLVNGPNKPTVFNLSHSVPSEHAERVLPMVNQVLDQANINRSQLDAIAFGQGPGGFTGIRIACGVAQGMGYGLGIPVIAVPSLQAVAWRAHQEISPTANAVYIVLQDARMSELYAAVYMAKNSDGKLVWKELHSPVLVNAEQAGQWINNNAHAWGVSQQVQGFVAGDALNVYKNLLHEAGNVNISAAGTWQADAVSIANIAFELWLNKQTLDPANAMPLYVREKVAFTIKERQQGAGGNPSAANVI